MDTEKNIEGPRGIGQKPTYEELTKMVKVQKDITDQCRRASNNAICLYDKSIEKYAAIDKKYVNLKKAHEKLKVKAVELANNEEKKQRKIALVSKSLDTIVTECHDELEKSKQEILKSDQEKAVLELQLGETTKEKALLQKKMEVSGNKYNNYEALKKLNL